MKKTKAILNKLVEEIERTPIVQAACDKVGISRNTFYRWMKEDEDFLMRVSSTMSLGTGLVNDVAESNVLEGIKRKDPMYTKYWLSHKHPDFRKPFIHKVDAEDLISHFRSTMEGVRKREIEEGIRDTITENQRLINKQAEKEATAFLEKWNDVLSKPNEEKAKELFEKWKKEYEEKNRKR